MTFAKWLESVGACGDAVEWVGKRSATRAWKECQRGDWMLWGAVKAGVDRKAVVLAACACARLSLRYVKAGEDRPRIAIETAEAWCRGEETIEQARAYAACAAYAAYAADHAARTKTLAQCADIVRKVIPLRTVLAAMRKGKT